MEEVIDADRVVVVDGGRIVDDGTPREIFFAGRAVKALSS